jgi:DMSO reductase anchor subunit
VFLTTLSGAAQGLMIVLAILQLLAMPGWTPMPTPSFFVAGAAAALVLGGLGLLASFFHLGHPERAWRAVAMWRTSWLSRECLALPMFLAVTFLYLCGHVLAWPPVAMLSLSVLVVLAAATLFVCTAMIYACLRFLREWASPYTLVNFVLLGCASGCTLATLCAAILSPPLLRPLALCTCVLILAACAARLASLMRNARLVLPSTLQSATGIRSDRLVQKSQGFTAPSHNMREFYHGRSPATVRRVKWGFLAGAFVLPLILLVAAAASAPGVAAPAVLLGCAFIVQYAGLLAERWFFFAEARHPQNLYYQRAS